MYCFHFLQLLHAVLLLRRIARDRARHPRPGRRSNAVRSYVVAAKVERDARYRSIVERFEAELGPTEEEARREARRCLRCDLKFTELAKAAKEEQL